MRDTLLPGYTRYWCRRCRRVLRNDPDQKSHPGDTVTARVDGDEVIFMHDGCKGFVEPANRMGA